MYCKACGNRVGDPEDDLHDPDNLMEIVEGGVSNPNDAHLKAADGAKGPRLYCRPTGKVTTIVKEDPNQQGEGGAPNESRTRSESEDPVYDVEEEKSQIRLLAETVSNPIYGLNDGQIDEIKEWAEIYDGRLPPDVLEKVVQNFSGVAKQTATLMREKYEAKINRWIREQSSDQGGPPIGVTSQPPRGRRGRSGRGSPRPSPETSPEEGGPETPDEIRRNRRQERRMRAMERRQDALDEATAEAARESIQELTATIRDGRNLLKTILTAKAEKDPDWFFENFDLLQSLGEPSEARKRELEAMEEGRQVDREVDEALQQVSEGSEPDSTVEDEPLEEEPVMEEPDEFEEVFGDMEEPMEAG